MSWVTIAPYVSEKSSELIFSTLEKATAPTRVGTLLMNVERVFIIKIMMGALT